MIPRTDLSYLNEWRTKTHRKPLVIRGARQVGKTELVREFSREFEEYIEINFDETPEKADFFNFGIKESVRLIEADSGKKITDGKILLFLDEVQSAPQVLPQLRYFYEKRPELHVIAAGSLLEFLLGEHDFSMPVGRIEYLFMGPMTFQEYLGGIGEGSLVSYIDDYKLGDIIPASIHQILLNHFTYFSIIGGMPEAQAVWLETDNITEVQKIHMSILQTYEDDFSKYGKKINPDILRLVLKRIPSLVGTKLKYVNIDRNLSQRSIINAIDTLEKAKLISRVFHCDGNGIPLGAETSVKKYKPLFLDTGLYCSSLGLRLPDIRLSEDLLLVNSGALTEQVTGQHLLYRNPGWIRPELYYWQRDKRSASSEIDYLITSGTEVIPVEIKAGKTGKLRSLHTFAALKKSRRALRFNSQTPSISKVKFEIQEIGKAEYTLISLPLYMIQQTERLLNTTV